MMLSVRELKKQVKKNKAIVRLQKVEDFLDSLPEEPIFDLVVTSPPYDIGKPYEKIIPLDEYRKWQREIIEKIVKRMPENGSICWQVGNYIHDGEVHPLDIELAPIFFELGLKLRNRIVWTFGHGMHAKRRFSGRHETILWFTKGDEYIFNLDDVRVPSKYPGKRHFKGAHKGELSGNPLGKNPEDVWNMPNEVGNQNPDDVWNIPNVVGNHIEKKNHPCQFPVVLAQRLIRALSNPGDLVFDPFAGSASTAVAALSCERIFIGTEVCKEYADIATDRIKNTINGKEKFRPDKPIYDHTKSNLSKRPKEWDR